MPQTSDERDLPVTRAYPDAKATRGSLGLMFTPLARDNAREPTGRGNTMEQKRSFPPQCGQHMAVRATGTSSVLASLALALKPCANSMRPLISSIGIE